MSVLVPAVSPVSARTYVTLTVTGSSDVHGVGVRQKRRRFSWCFECVLAQLAKSYRPSDAIEGRSSCRCSTVDIRPLHSRHRCVPRLRGTRSQLRLNFIRIDALTRWGYAGSSIAEVPTDLLPAIEWSTADLIALGRVANATSRTTLDLCSEKPGSYVSLTEIVDAAGVSRPVARAQLAGLTMVVKRRFGTA